MTARILCIDDNADSAALLCCGLQLKGYLCVSARTGDDGLQLAEAQLPAVVVLDLSLPDMEGYEVIFRLHDRFGRQGIKIIVVSAHVAMVDRIRALAAGADVYLTKPVDFPVFWETLEELLCEPAALGIEPVWAGE